MQLRVGIDVGGTFTDIAAYDVQTGMIVSFKVPSTPSDHVRAVIVALRMLLDGGDQIAGVIHGFTIATNAVLEGKGAKTALVTTRGFRDVLHIARMHRHHLYDTDNPGRPLPLVPRDLRYEITERVDAHGNIVTPLVTDEIPALITAMQAQGIEAVAVSLLFSYLHPAHEVAVQRALAEAVPFVTVSSEINAEFREYERTSTTVLNAYVMPRVHEYLSRLDDEIAALGVPEKLQIVQSNGGMMSAPAIRDRPVNTVMSGPAAGVAASLATLRQMGIANGVTFDMGGTSTDVCLIHGGSATVTSERSIGGHAVRVPSVAIETIGAGGGSLAQIDAVGALKVGPQSAGASPGPACYGMGGTEPTVTDANLVLGYLNPDSIWGGQIHVHPELSVHALQRFADTYGMTVAELAHGIVEIANANMIGALRLVSVQKGYDLRDFTLVAFGGAGPVHAGRLAQLLQIPRVVVPAFSGVFSALGCLVSDLRYDAQRTYLIPVARADPAQMTTLFAGMEARIVSTLTADGHTRETITVTRSLDLRYVGQKFEIEVPIEAEIHTHTLAEAGAEFHRRHHRLYSYATDEALECVNLRLTATVRTPHPPLAPPAPPVLPMHGADMTPAIGQRITYFPDTGEVASLVYDRAALPTGQWLTGPAIIEEAWSTVVVYPGQRATADRFGNLIIEGITEEQSH